MNEGARAMMETGKSEHQQIFDLLSDANTRLVKHRSKILDLSEALYGAGGAEVASDKAQKPQRPGLVGQILDGIEELRDRVDDIDNVFTSLLR